MAHTYVNLNGNNSTELQGGDMTGNNSNQYWIKIPSDATKMHIRFQNLKNMPQAVILYSNKPQNLGNTSGSGFYISNTTVKFDNNSNENWIDNNNKLKNAVINLQDTLLDAELELSYFDLEMSILSANSVNVKITIMNGATTSSTVLFNSDLPYNAVNLWSNETNNLGQLFWSPQQSNPYNGPNGSKHHHLELDYEGNVNSDFDSTYPIYLSFADVSTDLPTPATGTYGEAAHGIPIVATGNSVGDPFITPMFN